MTYHGQGEAASYYASAQQHQQQYPQQGQHGSGYGQPPQQHQQHGRDSHNDAQEGAQDGERGFLGAVGGGIAGAVGGNKIGGKVTGHSKTSTILGAVAGAIAGHKIQDGVEDWKDNRDEEKEKKKKEEEEKRRREEEEKRRKEEEKHRPHHAAAAPPKHHDEHRDRNLHYAGGFSGSSRDVRLDAHGEYMLHASCQRLDGSYQASSISLNKIIENDQGSFRWVSPGRRNNGGGQSTVTVQQGDTLRQIAARFNTSFEEIARHNNINNPDLIYPGQVLQIPGRSGGQSNNSSEGGFGSSARNVRLSDGGSRLDGELQRDGRWVGSSLILDERIGNNNGTLTFVD